MENIVQIYALVDPRDGRVRYVGKTTIQLKDRLCGHLTPSQLHYNNRKSNWIKSLISKGLKPCIVLLETVHKDYWEEVERYWIAYYRSIYEDLTNHADGGNVCPLSVEQHKASAERRKGVKRPAEFAQKMRETHTKEVMHVSRETVYARKRPNSTTGFIGVYYDKDSSKWVAQLRDKRTIKIGRYATPEEAALAYDDYVLRRYPKAATNRMLGLTGSNALIPSCCTNLIRSA